MASQTTLDLPVVKMPYLLRLKLHPLWLQSRQVPFTFFQVVCKLELDRQRRLQPEHARIHFLVPNF